MKIAGTNAIVFGGVRGIGRAYVEALLDYGAKVRYLSDKRVFLHLVVTYSEPHLQKLSHYGVTVVRERTFGNSTHKFFMQTLCLPSVYTST